MIAIAVALRLTAGASLATEPEDGSLGLRVNGSNNTLEIRWNAAAVNGPLMLFIREGTDEHVIPLAEEQLRCGRVMYKRHSNDVAIGLRTLANSSQFESVRYIAAANWKSGTSATAMNLRLRAAPQ